MLMREHAHRHRGRDLDPRPVREGEGDEHVVGRRRAQARGRRGAASRMSSNSERADEDRHAAEQHDPGGVGPDRHVHREALLQHRADRPVTRGAEHQQRAERRARRSRRSSRRAAARGRRGRAPRPSELARRSCARPAARPTAARPRPAWCRRGSPRGPKGSCATPNATSMFQLVMLSSASSHEPPPLPASARQALAAGAQRGEQHRRAEPEAQACGRSTAALRPARP